jgi:RNA polymerase sigma factor (sigma-70 family)
MRGSVGDDDGEIIERSLTEPAAFELIFERHYGAIYRYLARRLGIDTAGDLAAEVFLRAFDGRASYDTERSSSRPWLYGIAANVARSESRRRYRERRAVRRLPIPIALSDPSADIAWRVDTFRAVRDTGLLDAIAELRPDEQELLFLLAFGDATYAEIAEALGVPIGTVRSRLSRVRDKLREPLKRVRGIRDEQRDLDG